MTSTSHVADHRPVRPVQPGRPRVRMCGQRLARRLFQGRPRRLGVASRSGRRLEEASPPSRVRAHEGIDEWHRAVGWADAPWICVMPQAFDCELRVTSRDRGMALLRDPDRQDPLPRVCRWSGVVVLKCCCVRDVASTFATVITSGPDFRNTASMGDTPGSCRWDRAAAGIGRAQAVQDVGSRLSLAASGCSRCYR